MLSYLKQKLTGFHCPQGGGDSGGGGGTSVTKQEIPAELKPLANAYTSKAIGLSNQGFVPYTGQRYADLNATQNAGLDMIANRAMNGSSIVNNATNMTNSMINGGMNTQVGINAYAGDNPFLNNAINRSMDDVQGRINSQFAGSNYGTTANQQVLAQELGNVSSNMRMQDYGTQQQLAENAINRNLQASQQDTANRMAAAQFAPTLGNQAYQDAQQLMNAGQMRQDQAQQGLDFNYQQFQEQQDLPYKQLAAMGGVFGSNLGGSSTTTSNQSGGGGK